MPPTSAVSVDTYLTLWNHPYALTCALTFVLPAALAFFVLWKNRRSAAARWWAIMCLFVSGWAGWNTVSLLSPTAAGSLKYLRVADAFALFIPVTFLHFAMHFSERLQPRFLKISYLITTLIALTTPTTLFVSAGQKKFGIWFEVGGPTFAAFAVLFVVLPAYGLFLLYQAVQRSQGIRRAQLLSLFWACALGFGGGSMWFPGAFNIDIPPLGGHLIALYCVIVMYAIVRYQFLEIQIIIRRSLVYSLLVTLLTVGYFGLMYGVEAMFRRSLGYHSVWISLAAFALMALLFQPLKVGIQRLVDWLIFRVPQEELVRRVERLEQEVLQTEKLKAVSTMAAGMAHEIKNPLTALQTYGEFLPQKAGDPEFIKQCSEALARETTRIQGIVHDVLNFAKPKPPQFKLVNIESLINSTVNLLSSDLMKRGIQWHVDCQPNRADSPEEAKHAGATLHADADQLRQVLINLIQNAADAMPAGGKLTITTHADDGHLTLTIADTGAGIPAKLLPKIFDPFVTTKEHGTGLGLAMVRTIVESHRGSISVESRHGTAASSSSPARGTTFTLRFPR